MKTFILSADTPRTSFSNAIARMQANIDIVTECGKIIQMDNINPNESNLIRV